MSNSSPTRRKPLRWGVNHTPSDSWRHSRQDFNLDSVRAETVTA